VLSSQIILKSEFCPRTILLERQIRASIVPYTIKYLIYFWIVYFTSTVGSVLTQGSKRNIRPTDVQKTMCRNLNMKNQGNGWPPDFHLSNSTSESTDNELTKMSERQFRSLLLKMIENLRQTPINRYMKLGNQSKTLTRKSATWKRNSQGNGNCEE
jgi:hypothetical protein